MKTQFIPIDYDYFDFNGRNYTKIIGRNEKGKRICVIDTCPAYLWAILKENLAQKQIDKLISKETGLPVLIAEDPLSCVALGTGKALDQEETFSSMLVT